MSDTPQPTSGLVVANHAAHAPVPLLGVAVDAEITALCARVAVTQRYINRESAPIEAVYLFPLGEGAAVCGFEAEIDGTLVVGEVMERDRAFERYDDAMAEGHGAFLLDEERPDVFQASIGNLPPGKQVTVRISYVTELAADAAGVRFTVPTTISPRYAPAEDRTGVGRPDAETLNPPTALEVPYGLNLSVKVTMPGPMTRIESPSHPVSVAMQGATATVSLSQGDCALDRDFVVSIETASFTRPSAWVEAGEGGEQAAAVAFVPAFAVTTAPAELIFLVDRSGSMDGTSIHEVRNALQLCLRSMIPGCFFNIVGFGNRHQPLFTESRAYDDTSLKTASEHVAGLAADLGGTEILPALQFVLDQPGREGLPRQIVVLTDGEVTNTDAVLALARRHAGNARIFTFGIGAGASEHLVRGLARAGNGVAEFIAPGERIEPKVLRQFGRLLSPALTDVRIDWGGNQVTQAPAIAPAVFAGDRVIVYGLSQWPISGTATLSAIGPSGPLSFEVPLNAGGGTQSRESGNRGTVATLAARTRIRELEESPAWLIARASRQRRVVAAPERSEVVALSLKYGLLSRETSFVAIERRDQPVIGDIQLRRVPVALTAGWGDARRKLLVHPAAAFEQVARSAVHSRTVFSPPPAVSARRKGGGARAAASPAGPVDPRPMALIAMQRAGGWWELDDSFAQVLDLSPDRLRAAIRRATGDSEEASRAWATALAMAWLEQHARGWDEWRFVYEKAERWIYTIDAMPEDGRMWLAVAREFLRRAP